MLEPVTVAANWRVWLAESETEVGLNVTATAAGTVSDTVAEANLVGSATEAAVTATVCAAVMEAGAVYRPAAESVPTAGFMDQVTAVFVDPVTVAENCCVWLVVRDTEAGLICTAMTAGGASEMVEVADLVVSATDLAVTITVWVLAIELGAV